MEENFAVAQKEHKISINQVRTSIETGLNTQTKALQQTDIHTLKYALNNACREQIFKCEDLDNIATDRRSKLHNLQIKRKEIKSKWEEVVLDEAVELLVGKRPLKLLDLSDFYEWLDEYTDIPSDYFDTLIVAKTILKSGTKPFIQTYTTYRKGLQDLWFEFPAFASNHMLLQKSPSKDRQEDASLLQDKFRSDAVLAAEGTVIGPFWVLDSRTLNISETTRHLKLHRQLKAIQRKRERRAILAALAAAG